MNDTWYIILIFAIPAVIIFGAWILDRLMSIYEYTSLVNDVIRRMHEGLNCLEGTVLREVSKSDFEQYIEWISIVESIFFDKLVYYEGTSVNRNGKKLRGEITTCRQKWELMYRSFLLKDACDKVEKNILGMNGGKKNKKENK